MILVGIYDKKAEVYDNFTIFKSEADAFRSLGAFVNSDTSSPLHIYADDFTAYALCELDAKTGIITSRKDSVKLFEIKDLLRNN